MNLYEALNECGIDREFYRPTHEGVLMFNPHTMCCGVKKDVNFLTRFSFLRQLNLADLLATDWQEVPTHEPERVNQSPRHQR